MTHRRTLSISPELGESWKKIFYGQIRDSLGLDEEADRRSRDLLASLLRDRPFRDVRSLLEDNKCIVFGAGPSLEADIEGLRNYISEVKPVIIGADGAADALIKARINPQVVVSDLDSCLQESLQTCSRNGFVFSHAHGDNQDLIRAIVPGLGAGTIGTTQVETKTPVYNFGGFADGDRACFVASYFRPRKIIIAGMDYGIEEGRYSKNRYGRPANPKRPLKLDWGKKSLEFLISNSGTRFENVTKFGVEISGAKRVSYGEI